MGDPKKQKKKYDKPRHPWRMEKLEEERKIVKEYGLKNKRELWKMSALLRNFRRQARKLLAMGTVQAKKEELQLLDKLKKFNLINKEASLDDVLSLKIDDIMGRRLQTLVQKKGMATTAKQSREFIVHGHIAIGGSRVTSPSYLVKIEEENAIQFSENSPVKSLVLQKEKKEGTEEEKE